MKLNSVERATLKWLLKEAQGIRGYYSGGPEEAGFVARIAQAEEIIKRITVRPCNAKKMKKP